MSNDSADAVPAAAGDAGLVIGRVDHVEAELKKQIADISLGTLIGKWVGEHMMATGIGTVVTVVTFVGTIITGTMWVNNNFVDAAELGKSTQQIQQSIEQLQLRDKINNFQMRKWFLEQRIEDLEAKSHKTPADVARINHLKRDADSLNAQILEAQKNLH